MLRDGKIEAVGVDIKPPDDARIIEAHGKTIMPGIIDPFKEIVIAGGATVDAPQRAPVGGADAAGPVRAAAVAAGHSPKLPTIYILTIPAIASCSVRASPI